MINDSKETPSQININSTSIKNILTLSDQYTILLDKKLGGGAFGKLYSCINNKTKELYACKIENINTEKPQLSNEYKILNMLKNLTGFPKCIKFQNSSRGYTLIMERLGPNLETIMTKLPNKKYSMKTTSMIILQCLDRIKDIHDKGIIHRDMKPDNFVIGNKGKEKLIYLIDFGLSKIINNDKKNSTIKREKIIMGTMRYISMNTHLGNEQTKKDDLESLAYIIIYFIKGELPWQNVKANSKKEKYNKVYQLKKHNVPNGICQFLPEDIKLIVTYILNLNIKQKPDYQKLKNILQNLMNKYSYLNDLQFDWCLSPFINNLYTPNFIQESNIKSSSVFVEEDSTEENKKNIFSIFNSGKKKHQIAKEAEKCY